jgi:ATP-dependent protease ClpP protease subunit
MSNNRKEIQATIAKIEKSRNSKVLTFFTSDRKPIELFATVIATDVIPFFYDCLKSLGKCKNITLVLNSSGGILDAPWPIVNLIREYTQYLEVLVPSKAFSTATLICLGANKIIMLPYSQLSPIDPTGSFKQKDKTINISVEDVFGFVDLVKSHIGASDQTTLTEILKVLSGEISPTILGNVSRTFHRIRQLAKRLLELHLKNVNNKDQINKIIENLTEKLYSHSHYINRKEAKDIIGFGNIIEYANVELEENTNRILKLYEDKFQENERFDIDKILKTKNKEEFIARNGVIGSTKTNYYFERKFLVVKDDTKTPSIQINNIERGWKKEGEENDIKK